VGVKREHKGGSNVRKTQIDTERNQNYWEAKWKTAGRSSRAVGKSRARDWGEKQKEKKKCKKECGIRERGDGLAPNFSFLDRRNTARVTNNRRFARALVCR